MERHLVVFEASEYGQAASHGSACRFVRWSASVSSQSSPQLGQFGFGERSVELFRDGMPGSYGRQNALVIDDRDDDESRPLPAPPRCRGIPIGDRSFTGCAFGYGDVAPFTEPNDCPVCNGAGVENVSTTMAHCDFDGPECCGRLDGVVKGVSSHSSHGFGGRPR